MSMLHFYTLVSPIQWTPRVADELRLRLSAQIGVDVQLAADGIKILVPVDSPKASQEVQEMVENAVSTVGLEFADLAKQEGLTRLQITIWSIS